MTGKKSLIRSQALHDMQCLFMLCGWCRHKHTLGRSIISFHHCCRVATGCKHSTTPKKKSIRFDFFVCYLLTIIRVHWQWMKCVDTWSEARASCAQCREYIFLFWLCDKLWQKSNYMMKTIREGQKLNKNRKDNSNSITPTVNDLVTLHGVKIIYSSHTFTDDANLITFSNSGPSWPNHHRV